MRDLTLPTLQKSDAEQSINKSDSALVLVVDDQKLARTKLALAVKALGHNAKLASSGKQALELLEQFPVDLVLLDMIMPDQNGIDVLRALKAHPDFKSIPVIVISGLDDNTALAIEAIRLGAEDFLPKSFEPVLLRARINAGLRKKYNRDQELEELAQIRRLTNAAGLLEESLVTRKHLQLDDMIDRRDSLGQLARVFTSMAEKIYERERRLQRQYQALKGGMYLLIAGMIFGLNAPLSKVASRFDSHPLGYTLSVDVFVVVICSIIVLYRRRFPTLSWSLVRFLMLWGILGALLGDVVMFFVLTAIPSSTMSVVVVMASFMVFAIAALTGQEKADFKRFTGLLTGLTGILVIVGTGNSSGSIASPWWILLALLVPLSYACEGLYLSARYPKELDFITGIGLSTLAAAILLLPLAWMRNDMLEFNDLPHHIWYALFGMALVSIVANCFIIKAVQIAGAVFASQSSYITMTAGIGWAYLLLQEQLSAGTVVAVCMIIVGLLLVEPKREPDDVLKVGVYDN